MREALLLRFAEDLRYDEMTSVFGNGRVDPALTGAPWPQATEAEVGERVMSDKPCPSEAELLAFADADLTPERWARVKMHLERCGACPSRSRCFRV